MDLASRKACEDQTFLRSLRAPNRKDIEFEDISYSVRERGKNKDIKSILKSVSGKCFSGELTAILGPSGSGKTTLLNILAGYISSGVQGTIKINGSPRQMKTFQKLSCYIMQENLLQPLLSVKESMIIAANLKLSANISLKDKENIVDEILTLLGLEGCGDTRTEHLSGGEEKRASIALELIDNPPLIFLDEPLSGLDSFSTKQCYALLQRLASQGRTVICSVHQPPASLFEKLDQVYFMAEGTCVYNGAAASLVSFLDDANYLCPITYNPADYIVELSNYTEAREALMKEIKNGKENKRQLNPHAVISSQVYGETVQCIEDSSMDMVYPISFWKQFNIIFSRMCLQAIRNKVGITLQIMHHIMTGACLGALFFGIGKDAGQAFSVFFLLTGLLMQCVYTQVMVPLLIYPTELKLIQREYNNKWYNMNGYFMALCLRNIPSMTVLSTVCLLITYYMTDLPIDIERIGWFIVIMLLTGIASDALGVTIATVCNPSEASIVGPIMITPIVMLSIQGMGYGANIPPIYTYFMSLSFLRYAFVAICHVLYNGKPFKWECYDLYCHYKDPQLFLRDMGMADASFSNQILGVVVFIFIFRILGYIALKRKLRPEFIFSGVTHKQMM